MLIVKTDEGMGEPALSLVLLDEHRRLAHPAGLFGVAFGWKVEPMIYAFADRLSVGYAGGYWDMLAVSNGAFYMRPVDDGADDRAGDAQGSGTGFGVVSDNGFECRLSADALGLAACLYAYSHLNFGGARVGEELAQTCAQQYHLLQQWALSHPQAGLILAVIDRFSRYNNHHEQQGLDQAAGGRWLGFARSQGQSPCFCPPHQAGTHQCASSQEGFGRGLASQAAQASWSALKGAHT